MKRIKNILAVYIIFGFLSHTNGQVSNSLSSKETTEIKHLVDSIDFKIKSRRNEIKPLLKISTGLGATSLFLAIQNSSVSDNGINRWRDNTIPNFENKLDDYFQFAPIGVAYGLDFLGLKSKNNFVNRSWLLFKSEVFGLGVAYILKTTVDRTRPDGRGRTAFISGHTTQAFIAASFLHHEYKHHSPWFSIGGYTMATSVAVFRVLNDRHYVSDVLMGAVTGTVVTELVYRWRRVRELKRKKIKLIRDRKSYNI